MENYNSLNLPVQQIGKSIRLYDVTASTNDAAAQLNHDPKNHGTIILARRQTAGRGQYGRSWHSQPDQGIWISVLLFPPAEICQPAMLTAWAAVAVRRTIHSTINRDSQIKWPNDVLIDSKKVCGILLEAGPTKDPKYPLAVVTGIGLNLFQTKAQFEEAGLMQATSLVLATMDEAISLEATRDRLIMELDEGYVDLLEGRQERLRIAWETGLGLMHRQVRAELPEGKMSRGILRRVDFNEVILEIASARKSLSTSQIKHLWLE
jgi:BirA family transcriptional regulator, biotin operon repressor / biotin---[acetyl-CoA-carboxylase] ligase